MSIPLNLAEVTDDDHFNIDAALNGDDGLFLPDTDDLELHHKSPLDSLHPDADDINIDDAAVTAIKASLSQAQAQAAHYEQEQQRQSQSPIGKPQRGKMSYDGASGSESNPVENPEPSLAPFVKVDRGPETPLPEHIFFSNKDVFDKWLEGESSWCHFVQRRTTTPQKRAEERMKSRVKAHEKALMEMTPDEAANAPPLKKRRRLRTSLVHEKITFTCHHAGAYASKHSEDIPEKKQRKNTKQSVKCNCPSRVVLTQFKDGECRAQYFWQHEGHDPYQQGELESGRLPKVVDDWLVQQIHEGKDTDQIRKMLSITEEEKAEYLAKAAADPSYVDPERPPALAFQMKIKYPDIYNRYRKLKGPIRAIKPPKSRKNRVAATSESMHSIQEETAQPESIDGAMLYDAGDQGPTEADLDEQSLQVISGMRGLEDVASDGHVEHQFDGIDLSGHEMLAQLANQHGHVDLAQALLRLPANPDDSASNLEAEVLKMASMTGGGEDMDGNVLRAETPWEAIQQLQDR